MLFTRQPSWTGIARYILEIACSSSSLHDFKKIHNAIQSTVLDTKLHVTTILFSSGTLSFFPSLLLISNKNITKSWRFRCWFGWCLSHWSSPLEAPGYILYSVIKTTTFIVLAFLSLYPIVATFFPFLWVNTVAFVV